MHMQIKEQHHEDHFKMFFDISKNLELKDNFVM